MRAPRDDRNFKPYEPPGTPGFWQSTAGVALITVVIGGIFSTAITGLVQRGAKQREFENEMIKSFGQHRLEMLKSNLSGQRDALVSALQLLGRTVARSQSRIDICGPAFAQRLDPIEEAENAKQKKEIRGAFNTSWQDWASSKDATGYKLSYYFGHTADPWSQIADRTSKFMTCADTTRDGNWSDQRCAPERDAMDASTTDLLAHLKPVNTAWLSASDIAQLRTVLEQVSRRRSLLEPFF
jgi:hypothetical protein